MCPSAPMPHSRMHDVNGCRKMHPTTKRDVLHFIPIHIRFYPLLGGFCSSQLHLTIHALRGKPSQTKLADPTGGATRSPPPLYQPRVAMTWKDRSALMNFCITHKTRYCDTQLRDVFLPTCLVIHAMILIASSRPPRDQL